MPLLIPTTFRTGPQGLRAQYDQDLAQPLPHRLFTLLMQLGEPQNTERGERPEQDRPDR
jgi:hypothetical protein